MGLVDRGVQQGSPLSGGVRGHLVSLACPGIGEAPFTIAESTYCFEPSGQLIRRARQSSDPDENFFLADAPDYS
jgi:hypothetical protein